MVEILEGIQIGLQENLILLIIILLLTIGVAPLIASLFVLVFGSKSKRIGESSLFKPVKVTFYALGFYILIHYINLTAEALATVQTVVKVVIIGLITICVTKLVGKDSRFMNTFFKNFNVKKSAGNFIDKIFKVVIIILGIFAILTELGYDITSLIASIGVVGVVVALAAQDTAKSLLSGITIIADKPFKVGDWVNTGEIQGVVEDLTLKGARIRRIDGMLAVVPNSVLADQNVITNSKLKTRKYLLNIEVTLDTKLEQIHNVSEIIKKEVDIMQNVITNSTEVIFDKITPNGFNILIYMQTDLITYESYLKFKEIVNYKVIHILQQNKIELAYNTQTIYMKQD